MRSYTPQGSFVSCKYPRWAINKTQNKKSIATKKEMVATVPRLVVQHKATALPAAVVKSQTPSEEDPVWDI